jgi:Bacterial transglutaminase-like N-terminal region
LITLRIHHRTTYRYRQPVSLGPHRLMLRPRESRDLRLLSSNVAVTPAATVTWAHDVFGNAIATANFQTMADNLVIDAVAELQLDAAAWPILSIKGRSGIRLSVDRELMEVASACSAVACPAGPVSLRLLN